MSNVVPFPAPKPVKSEIFYMTMDQMMQVLTKQKTVADIKCEQQHEIYLNELRSYDIPTLRRFWDEVSDDDSFYHGPEGEYDCADIHRILNEKGDGYYCAV